MVIVQRSWLHRVGWRRGDCSRGDEVVGAEHFPLVLHDISDAALVKRLLAEERPGAVVSSDG